MDDLIYRRDAINLVTDMDEIINNIIRSSLREFPLSEEDKLNGIYLTSARTAEQISDMRGEEND